MDQKSWMPCTSKIWPPTCNNFSFNLLLVSKSIAFYYFLNQNMHVLFILKVTVNFLRLIDLYRMSWWPIEITIWLFSTHSIFIWYFSSILLMAAPSFPFSNQFSFLFPFFIIGSWHPVICCFVWRGPVSSLWSCNVIHGSSKRQNDCAF